MGWYQMFTESELIPLSAISTGKIQDNLFVAENCTDGGYYRYDTFTWTELTSVSETEFIPCSSNEHFLFYTGQVNSGFHIVFKNSNGEIFTGFKRNADSNKCIDFVAPPGATSFACAFNTPYKSEIKIGHAAIQQDNLDEYVKSVNNDFFKGKKMNCLGDSITHGYTPGSGSQMERPYPTVVKELLGLDTVRNYGINGSRLANTGSNPIVTRYSDMDNDADIICVFGGTNDWSNNNALGTIDSTDNTSIYGALNELCSGLITKYPKATIFFISPLRRTNDATANSKGYELKDVQIAIEDVCGKYSIPVLDLYSCGNFYPSNSTQNTQLSGDGLHPNQWYHENILAPKIADFLRLGAINCNDSIISSVPISKGGTGATTANEAITKLGVAPASHTHVSNDITDTIPISKGGTGATTVDDVVANLQVVKSGYSSNTPESFALYPHIDGRIKIQLRCLGATGGGQVNSGTPSTSITIAIDKVNPSRYMLYVTCYNNGVSSINTICSNALKINAFNSLGTVSISATDGGNLDNVVQTTLMLGIPY